jgi:hypothetical protein
MTTQWQPYREPLHTTALRTFTIALVVGAIISHWWGGPARWPAATLLALWPAFGGHWIEIAFLNWLRPRISQFRAIQITARVIAWFLGGLVLAVGMALTARAINAGRPIRLSAWWIAGLGFIAIELIAHLFLQVRGRPSFYNGRG